METGKDLNGSKHGDASGVKKCNVMGPPSGGHYLQQSHEHLNNGFQESKNAFSLREDRHLKWKGFARETTGGTTSTWISRWIRKRVLASPGSTAMVGVESTSPVMVRTF
ncbi:hypothetical protein AVEN_54239-1 [Araneus ventricosus]|uniref:Uncharacterized protein n=1 Tax=Araneus ventricosus TaxID=182803 RepID=A0A4Y2PII3_ARAVE|nr:hypothetical protein AVEN_54239-1 [Araneus ventricosus]